VFERFESGPKVPRSTGAECQVPGLLDWRFGYHVGSGPVVGQAGWYKSKTYNFYAVFVGVWPMAATTFEVDANTASLLITLQTAFGVETNAAVIRKAHWRISPSSKQGLMPRSPLPPAIPEQESSR